MLCELAVSDLGVIDDLRLVLDAGMTALTGETGAGKTLLVEAIELLVGGRADSVLVRPGSSEATVEGRFDLAGEEVVLTRVVPADGRSRSYVNGRMATAAALAEWGDRLVDLHGQHSHQSLLLPATQRDTLDRYADVDLEPRFAAQAGVREIDAQLAALGGDAGARAREIDLLRFQIDELESAAIADQHEERCLEEQEATLANAVAHREAAATAVDALARESGASDAVATAIGAATGHPPFAEHENRLRALAADLADIASELRNAGETIVDDPEQLAAVRERRQLLVELRRKYASATVDGRTSARTGSLADVLAYLDDARARLADLQRHGARVAELDAARRQANDDLSAAETKIGDARRAAAPEFARSVQKELRTLAMPKARLDVEVGPGAGDEVSFKLAANPGGPPLPLTKVASGGELARVMLAIRLVLTAAPPTLVFDEVDAGIGGDAALAVGRSLAAIGAHHQVLVVTHLAQVAAFADQQVRIAKRQGVRTTVCRIDALDAEERVHEVSRMLSGSAAGDTARSHARDLLATAASARGR